MGRKWAVKSFFTVLCFNILILPNNDVYEDKSKIKSTSRQIKKTFDPPTEIRTRTRVELFLPTSNNWSAVDISVLKSILVIF